MPKKSKTQPATIENLATLSELDELRQSIEKDLGGGVYFGNSEQLRLRWLPLGIRAFDDALGGGFPMDRIVLLIGQESHGKTVLATLAIKAAQHAGLSCGFVDVEHTWTPEWAAAVGVDLDKVLVVRPRTGEEAFDAAVSMVQHRVAVVVFDSLAGAVPKARTDGDPGHFFESNPMADRARLVNNGLAMLSAENRGSLIIVVNQLREGVGVMFGNPEVLPGGKGQRFTATQVVRVRRQGFIEEGAGNDKRKLGFNMLIRAEKNKAATPYGEGVAPFYYTGEFDELVGVIDQCVEFGVIKDDRPNYYLLFNESNGSFDRKVYGRQKMIDTIRGDEELQAKLKAALDQIEQVEV